MSRYRFAEIHCDIRLLMETVQEECEKIPYKHKDWWQPGHVNMNLCANQAKKAGWQRKKIAGVTYDFCPACVDMLNGERNSHDPR